MLLMFRWFVLLAFRMVCVLCISVDFVFLTFRWFVLLTFWVVRFVAILGGSCF